MRKMIHENEGKHRIPYTYLLNKVFKHYDVCGTKGTSGIVKQMIRLATLMENECIEDKDRFVSQVFELLAIQERMGKEIEELRIMLAAKVIEIVHLKLEILKMSSEGQVSIDELAAQNVKLKNKIIELTSQVQRLTIEVKAFTKQLLGAHAAVAERLDMVLKLFSPKHPSI